MRIGKFDAARRQLRTAITLWFNDGDPVSTHTLAFAAYEVIHAISEKRDPNRRDLLFDAALVKDEYRREFNVAIRKHANFFKHADRNGDSVIDFDPRTTEIYLMFAIVGVALCGESHTEEESIFLWWLQINRPDLLTDQGHKMVADHIPVHALEDFRALSKREFLRAFQEGRRRSERLSSGHTNKFGISVL
jgi:hypothetical protein